MENILQAVERARAGHPDPAVHAPTVHAPMSPRASLAPDVEKRLSEMAQARDKSVARLKAEMQKEGRLDGLRHQIREEKTLDLLLSRAKINEKAPEASSPTENSP